MVRTSLLVWIAHQLVNARPALSARSSELAEYLVDYELSDRYQIRQMVETSQISPVLGTFT